MTERKPCTALERLKRGRHICGDKCPEMPPALCMSCGIKRQVKRAVAAERRRVLKAVRLSRIAWVSCEDMGTMLLAANALLRHWDKRKGGRGER